MKVKSMQRPGTKAIQNPNESLKLKREITKIINIQDTKRTYGLPSEQLFPYRWSLSNPNRTKNNIKTRKVNVIETLSPKQATGQHWNGR